MSIISGFKKYKNYKADENGDHQLQSFWTSSDSVDGNITEASTRTNLVNGETLTTSLGKIKKFFSDLGTSAFKNTTDSYSASGTDPVTGKAVDAALKTLDVTGASNINANQTIASWSETDGKVSLTTQNIAIANTQVSGLGTASTKNVASSGDASTSQVVMGNDSRLTNARPASDVSAWAKASTKPTYTASEVGAIATTAKGANNGVAELDSTGKVPSNQLPSFVDDVVEYNSLSDFPATGESGKIYIAKDTNKTYRWSGTAYVEISPSLALGETSSTAYRGDRGKIAYDHSQTTSGNPHNVTKSDVGLGNVGNFKAVSTVASQGLTDTEKANARANIGAGTSSFSGAYADLSGKPTLGTAAAKDVPSSGNASTSQVVLGSDTRLSDSRNAADVYSWAKASTKPTYTASEVGLGNVGNYKAVSTVADQGLTDTEKANSRANIGAGTSNFSGAYADLSGKPTVPSKTSQLTNDSGFVTTDTKNTAGSTDTSSKIFLVGATSQAANPQTYSHDTAYVGTDGCLYSGGTKVLTSHQDISGKADKTATVSTVTWDSTNKKLTKTINGSTTDVVTGATILGGLTKAQVTTALGYTPPTSDTNTHRPIQMNGTEILGNNTTALNLKAGSNVSLSNSSGTVTITATDTNTWRGIQDNLTSSTNTTESLSAKQGYLLANGSARDSTKIPLSGTTALTGSIVPSTSGSVNLGSSSYNFNGIYAYSVNVIDVHASNTLSGSLSLSHNKSIYFTESSSATTAIGTRPSTTLSDNNNNLPTGAAVISYLNSNYYARIHCASTGQNSHYWKNAANGFMQWFFYEGANTTTYSLPTAHCIVVVWKYNSARGVAFAYQWNSTAPNIWKANMHDTWQAWQVIK